MRKVEVTVYKYDELPKPSKSNVFDRHQESMSEDNADQITDMFAEKLSELYYPTNDIRWRLSYSQGDGVAFYGRVEEPEMLAKRLLDKALLERIPTQAWQNISINISSRGNRYHHWNTMNVEVLNENEEVDFPQAVSEELESAIKNDVIKLSKEFEKTGYEYIYPTDEVVEESLRELDEDYYIDGRIYTPE